MSKKASPILIGTFTLIGLILAGVGLVLFGAGKWFENRHLILLYFDKSANGLLVGSEVRFGGVKIGQVSSISVIIDQKARSKIIPVIVDLAEKSLESVTTTTGAAMDFSSPEGVENAVKEGLRAQMKQQSLLTGQLYIEFDIVANTPGFVYEATVKPEHPVVPTIATGMDELIAGVSDGLKKFNALDLDGVMKDLRELLESTKEQVSGLDMKAINTNVVAITEDVRKLTSDEKLPSALKHLDEALASFQEVSAKLDKNMDPLMADMRKTMENASASLKKLEETSAELSSVANPRGPVLMRLQNVLEEMERASRAVKELANDLKRNPNSLLTGKEAPKP